MDKGDIKAEILEGYFETKRPSTFLKLWYQEKLNEDQMRQMINDDINRLVEQKFKFQIEKSEELGLAEYGV